MMYKHKLEFQLLVVNSLCWLFLPIVELIILLTLRFYNVELNYKTCSKEQWAIKELVLKCLWIGYIQVEIKTKPMHHCYFLSSV